MFGETCSLALGRNTDFKCVSIESPERVRNLGYFIMAIFMICAGDPGSLRNEMLENSVCTHVARTEARRVV
jgi:hypothetical protein